MNQEEKLNMRNEKIEKVNKINEEIQRLQSLIQLLTAREDLTKRIGMANFLSKQLEELRKSL